MSIDTVRRIVGPTIKTASGDYFDLEDPDFRSIKIEDIGYALAMLCRYTGHCNAFYSVAQHSVLVSTIVPAEHALAGLLHDAAEAYIGDVSKPLKSLLPDYKRIEARIEAAVFKRFGLPEVLPDAVKRADLILLRTEQRDLMNADGEEWSATKDFAPLAQRIEPWSPKMAQAQFIARFLDLTAGDEWLG